MGKKKVIVAGHICLDITPVFPDNRAAHLEDVLAPGKLVEVKEADVHTGGCVANTGLAMKILGADVTLMGKIGRDAFGDMVLNILRSYDADSGMLFSDSISTSYSVVVAVPGIDRIFLHNPGANNAFRADDVPKDIPEDISLFHFGYPPIMKAMYENDGAELVKLMRRMKEAGVATSMDMAAVDAASEAGRADWEKILSLVLPYVDFFVPSVEELCFMLDRRRFDEWQKRAGGKDITGSLDVEKDIRPLAEKCMKLGAKVVLIKCGAPGIYYRTADEGAIRKVGGGLMPEPERWADLEGFERSYVPERIASGTGAGDTSIAAFLTAVLDGCPLEECLRLATATGASCVAAYDALSGLKTFDELRKKIKQGWEKQNFT